MPQNLSRNTADRGVLILVVGPSGVGKDSMIEGARAALADDPDVVFVRRDITRAVDAGGEQHHAVDDETFRESEKGGVYALSWAAHGQSYGIPRSIDAELGQGRTVVVNASRAILDTARARYPRVVVCNIIAPADVLRRRLAARGRETSAEVEERVARAGAFSVQGEDVVLIDNGGPLSESVRRLVDVIRSGR
ncbi:MAG: phosphonate metabolism protein/1,5-bisphosphokinase (PRPP-forming) PhnN [Hyphomonadaceae bacterium]|nr:MAG: phnN [Caulobacteraceae bacterium]MBT9445657.1 phosphonate metabolism protein/1,5-bisphosphokinase (PRPP-forming) PhnN [Hyphomonadaceae bacterium]